MELKFSFLESEYVPAGRSISIYAQEKLHLDANHHCLELIRGNEELTPQVVVDGNHLKIGTGDLVSGTYRLAVQQLFAAGGKQINTTPTAASRILRIQHICGHVPENLRILRVLHLAVGDLRTIRLKPGDEPPIGTYRLDVLKVLGPKSHCVRTLALDSDGNTVRYEDIQKAIAYKRLKKFGPIEERLWSRLMDCTDEEEVPVAIWPKLDHDHCGYDKIKYPSGLLPGSDTPVHIAAFQRPKASLIAAVGDQGAGCNHHSEFPYITTTLTRSQIEEVAKCEDVGSILAYRRKPEVPCGAGGRTEPPVGHTALSETTAISRCLEAHAKGHKGKGVKVAVWELAGGDDLQYLDFVDIRKRAALPPPDADEGKAYHMQHVCSIIKNIQPPPHIRGYAPDCDLYLANYSLGESSADALQWAVDQGCSVVNMSWTIPPHFMSPASDLNHDDQVIDWVATTPPHPLVVSAAGNQGPETPKYVVNKQYNGLIVGNHDQLGNAMAADSLFTNPDPQDATHDRELPDIAACGERLTLLVSINLRGTSFAAPAVAGTVALLHAIDPDLRQSPEAVRAIMYAAAGRHVGHPYGGGPSWWDEIRRPPGATAPWPDAKDGAGMLDTASAVKIARSNVNTSAAVQCGWARGTLDTALFRDPHPSPYQWTVKTGTMEDAGGGFDPAVKVTLKVALAWNSWAYSNTLLPGFTDELRSKFGLTVHRADNDTVVAAADSFDNNYEIVEFEADQDRVYNIYIIFQWQQTPPMFHKAYTTWFGIAWQFYWKGRSW